MVNAMQEVEIESIIPSRTNPRKNFDKKKMDELIESVKEKGVLMPVLLRPIEDDRYSFQMYELVFGERRYRAAKEAGLENLPAVIRDLDDREVLEIQVIENLQRDDLHPIEEAEGYEQIIAFEGAKHRACSPEDIAAKISKSVSYVYGRLKLCELIKEARKAFYDGKMSASVAELVARIPPELQPDALRWIESQYIDEAPVPFRKAKQYIHDNYTLSLKAAGFDTKDKDLVPLAGPCSTCPKRTGNLPELFPDIKSTDVCTDPSCFRKKRLADYEHKTASCRGLGYQIMDLADSRQIFTDGAISIIAGGDYVNLKGKCEDDPRNPKRTYGELLKELPVEDQIAAYDDMGTMHLIVRKSIALSHMRKTGNDFKDDTPADQVQRKAKTKEDKKADKFQALARPRVFAAIIKEIVENAKKYGQHTKALRIVARDLQARVIADAKTQYEKAEGAIKESFKLPSGRKILTAIDAMNDHDLVALILAFSVIFEHENTPAGIDPLQGPLVKRLCNSLDIDARAIAKKVLEEVKEEEAKKNPAPAAKPTKMPVIPVKKKDPNSFEVLTDEVTDEKGNKKGTLVTVKSKNKLSYEDQKIAQEGVNKLASMFSRGGKK